MVQKIIIAAISKNGVIGKDGSIPWHIKEELQHFKNTTMGFPVIMGRLTFESIKKTLPGRLNIILSQTEFPKEGDQKEVWLNSLQEAYQYCEKRGYLKAFIIGGGSVFTQALHDADRMIISYIDIETEGDTYFPLIHTQEWAEENVEKRKNFKIVNYIRKKI